MLTIIGIALIPLIVTWVAKIIFPHKITWTEWFVSAAVCCVFAVAGYFVVTSHMMRDVEILNGQVTGKDRIHDSYRESYSCNCRTDRDGNRTCDTCYRTIYTVEWICKTNIRTVRVDYAESESKSVYKKPDPKRYEVVQVGEPVALENSYTNYIKAAPSSLFNKAVDETYTKHVPNYPKVYDLYRVNRILNVGEVAIDSKTWNDRLSEVLKTVGPQKQANIIIVLVQGHGQEFASALEAAWLGGKKNDVIVVIGVSDQQIVWSSVISWTDNELFKVQLRDEVYAQKTLDISIIDIIAKHTLQSFVRKPMEDFEYLKDNIEMGPWTFAILFFFAIVISIGLSYFFYRKDPFDSSKNIRYHPRKFR